MSFLNQNYSLAVDYLNSYTNVFFVKLNFCEWLQHNRVVVGK